MIAIRKTNRNELSQLVREVQATWSPDQRRQRIRQGELRSRNLASLIGLYDAAPKFSANTARSMGEPQRLPG